MMWHLDDTTAAVNGTAPQAFGSRHPGGAYFGFGDGSVRFFPQQHRPGDDQVARLPERRAGDRLRLLIVRLPPSSPRREDRELVRSREVPADERVLSFASTMEAMRKVHRADANLEVL